MSAKTSGDSQTVRAHITVHDAKEAIAFYGKAFGATEMFRLSEPSGRIGHAEIRIGDSILMLNDEYPDFGAKSPAAIGGSPVAFHIRAVDCLVGVGPANVERHRRAPYRRRAWS